MLYTCVLHFCTSLYRSGGSKGGARGARAPPLFLDQTEAPRAKKIFLGDPPPIWSSGSATVPFFVKLSPTSNYKLHVKNVSRQTVGCLFRRKLRCKVFVWVYDDLGHLNHIGKRERASMHDVAQRPSERRSLVVDLLRLNGFESYGIIDQEKKWNTFRKYILGLAIVVAKSR